jgi:uncharacterized protein
MAREGDGKTVLITGASAGIGAAFAHVFAENGFQVVLTARREERLRALARELGSRHGVRTEVIGADLADPSAPARIIEEIAARGLVVDALVNNAGYGVGGKFRRAAWQEHAAFLQVLITAVTHLVHLVEPGMIERRYGRIINVASLAAFAPGTAGHTLYGAAKAFVLKFSESLALEHQGDGVHVSAVCPGFTYSEFHDVLGNRALVKQLPSYMWMHAETVAKQGYRAVMAGKPVYVNGAFNRVVASAFAVLPGPLMRAVARRQSKKIRIA